MEVFRSRLSIDARIFESAGAKRASEIVDLRPTQENRWAISLGACGLDTDVGRNTGEGH